MKFFNRSVSFYVLLISLSFASLLGFVFSSTNKVTREKCEALGFPILDIETDKGKAIKSKEKYVKASYSIEGLKGKCRIRGHGNSTWFTTFTSKKPYLLKLNKPASLLGFPESQKWILLANTSDRTMLRNFYAEYLAHKVWGRMPWSPSSKFITLFINGKYIGLYGLTEKIDIVPGRIELEGEGFLAEVGYDRLFGFNTYSTGLHFGIRQPKAKEKKYQKWAKKINSLEELLYEDNYREKDAKWKKKFDIPSFIDWYLLHEFSKNYDSPMYHSVFMFYDYGKKKLFMGPAWDHDIAFGNTQKGSTTNGFRAPRMTSTEWLQIFNFFDMGENSTAASKPEGFLINQSYWFNRMFGDEEFVENVKARWQETRDDLDKSLIWLKEQGNLLEEAALLNDSVWHIIGSSLWPRAPGYRKRRTYQSEVDYLCLWIEKRIAWLDSMFLVQ